MTQNNGTATLAVETDKLFKALKSAFASSTSVLAELMQNARRAHAREVRFEILEANDAQCGGETSIAVSDDGEGIGDFSLLLRLGVSGWDAETQACDDPYGIGFLAAVFACRHLTVTSRGSVLSAPTEYILKGQDVPVLAAPDGATPQWGSTRIVLKGVALSKRRVGEALRTYAQGFPLVVRLDGAALARPHALRQSSEVRFVDTEVGAISVRGIHRDVGAPVSWDLELYLQGLPVAHGLAVRSGVVVHLDPRQFAGRWPDRDALYEQNEAIARVQTTARRVIVEFLTERFTALGAEAFLDRYYEEFRDFTGVQALFRQVPYVHRRTLLKPSYPIRDRGTWWNPERATGIGRHIALEELARGEVHLVDLGDELDAEDVGNALSWMAAYAGAAVYGVSDPDKLPEWARRFVLTDEDLAVVIEGRGREMDFSFRWVEAPVVLCERYRIVHRRTGVTLAEVSEDACYLPYDAFEDGGTGLCILCPAGERSGQVVEQACSFVWDDALQEDDADAEMQAFSRLLLTIRGESAKVLEELLADSQASALVALFGHRYLVSFDAAGRVSVAAA